MDVAWLCGTAGNGTADIALVYMGRVTVAEQQVVAANFDRAEYEAVQWLRPDDPAAQVSLHPAVRRHAPIAALTACLPWHLSALPASV